MKTKLSLDRLQRIISVYAARPDDYTPAVLCSEVVAMALEICEARDVADEPRKLADIARSHERAQARIQEALEWYGEQARLCRLIHSEGDKGRNALAADGGKRALEAIGAETPK